jgi:hypothetical protein
VLKVIAKIKCEMFMFKVSDKSSCEDMVVNKLLVKSLSDCQY